ncbi:MAG: hypothetical protein ABMA64_13610 [Myxococcota bacterium]
MLDGIGVAIVFLGMSSLVAVPLGVTLGLPLAAWLGRGFLKIREREVELKRLEVLVRLQESRLLPAYVDRGDPEAVMAWMRADRELARLTAAPDPQ